MNIIKYSTLFFVTLMMLTTVSTVMGNDIQINNVRLLPAAEGSPDLIQFDIAWENSWRHPFSTGINNWDAAWVFVKYREAGNTGADWSHLYLSNTPGEYAAGTWGGDGAAGVVIYPALIDPRVDVNGTLLTPYTPAVNGNPAGRNPVVGAFVYRENPGRGRFKVEDIGFVFGVAENGLDTGKLYDFKVFAIEMVYVPQGSFFVGSGSGGSESGRFIAGGGSSAFQVTESWTNQIGGPCIDNTVGCLWGTQTSGTRTIGGTGNLDVDFPTGFHSFYMMKYSITQQQYVDFLNTLTRTQQEERFSSTTVGNFMHSSSTQTAPANRNGVRLMGDPGGTAPRLFGCDLNNSNTAGESDDGQWIAMNWLSWMDGAAYLDWAGLRPMTELEYEKAARGPLAPIANGYAWGTTDKTAATGFNNPGANNESASNVEANSVFGNQSDVQGPIRVGSFATVSSNRQQSGSSYWGIMELSGNLWEYPVTLGDETGRVFTGLHGNGALSENGNANNSGWPGLSGDEVKGATGSGFRGGNWDVTARLRVSDREFATLATINRSNRIGFRGVRSAGCFNNAAAPTFDTTGSLSPVEVSEGELVTYKVTSSGSYLWVVPNDWKIISGQGTNEIKVFAGSTVPGTVRVAAYNSCGAGEEASQVVDKTLEPYTLTLDAFFEAAAQERYTVRLNISTTRDANLLFRTRPVPGEVDRQMRFDDSFFDTRNPSGSFTSHSFAATSQPDGEFLAIIRDVPGDHTLIIFEMIAVDFPNGSTTFKFELEVFDTDRGVIVFKQVLEDSYTDF